MAAGTRSPIVGYIDGLGYLRCAPCAVAADLEWGRIVWRDSAPHNTERCDFCHRVVSAVAS